MHQKGTRSADESGVQVIEFVALLPLLALAALVVWQFTVFFYATMVAGSAAAAGARAAAVHGDVATAVHRGSAGLQSEFEVDPRSGCRHEGESVSVKVSVRVPFSIMPWVELQPLDTIIQSTAWCEPGS